MVIYDEIENFKEFNSKDFDYPYTKRKTHAAAIEI